MIIFGTGRKIVGQTVPRHDCSYCGQQASVGFYYQVRYFHIFWIPVFPYRTITGSQCMHCRQVRTGNELPPQLLAEAKVGKPRPPLKYFSGIFVGIFFALLIAAAVINERNATGHYLEDPKVGDVYGIKQENGRYTLLQLMQLHGDSVGFRVNNYEVDLSSQLSSIRRDHGDDYSDDVWFYAKGELKALLDDQRIVNIQRP